MARMKPRGAAEKGRLLSRPLLRWFARSGRDLPWRRTRDPYRIWVSEVMLQQTQVERVAEYYRTFLQRFPTVRDLARASWPQVLAAWRGLGYYRRARQMLAAAKRIVAEHGGSFPRTVAELETLPGVGPYTARAVAVFAYEEEELVLDTNSSRVLARALGTKGPDPRRWLATRAEEIVPRGKSWPFHQALMDLGALICIAHAPRCPLCPLAAMCAFARPSPESERSGSTKTSRREPRAISLEPRAAHHTDVAAALIFKEGRLLITTRPRGHLKGCWVFPGGKREGKENWRACLKRKIREELGVEVAVRPHDWEIVHPSPGRTLRIRFHRCLILRGQPRPRDGQRLRWVPPRELSLHRFPPADASVIAELSRARFVDPQASARSRRSITPHSRKILRANSSSSATLSKASAVRLSSSPSRGIREGVRTVLAG